MARSMGRSWHQTGRSWHPTLRERSEFSQIASDMNGEFPDQTGGNILTSKTISTALHIEQKEDGNYVVW